MKNKQVDLRKFTNAEYEPGSIFNRVLWYIVSMCIFTTRIPFPYRIKCTVLKLFGARIGKGVIIKPCVNIKYPWFLELGDNVWIGEEVWIDNLTDVKIGNNVCLSQGALLLTGNHDYKRIAFNLIVRPIIIEQGVWVGAKAVICPGVTLRDHSVVTVGSIVTKDTEPCTVYQGNAAKAIRKRIIE